MANRSDFFNAKLPRSIKRMLTMSDVYNWSGDQHNRGLLRRTFIEAHANHVGFKMKRQAMDNGSSEET